MEPCKLCIDGAVFEKNARGYDVMYRCRCPLGDKHATQQYFPSDKNQTKPFTVPLFGGGDRKPKADPRARAAGEKET